MFGETFLPRIGLHLIPSIFAFLIIFTQYSLPSYHQSALVSTSVRGVGQYLESRAKHDIRLSNILVHTSKHFCLLRRMIQTWLLFSIVCQRAQGTSARLHSRYLYFEWNCTDMCAFYPGENICRTAQRLSEEPQMHSNDSTAHIVIHILTHPACNYKPSNHRILSFRHRKYTMITLLLCTHTWRMWSILAPPRPMTQPRKSLERTIVHRACVDGGVPTG